MREPWQFAEGRVGEFDAEAVAYHRYRPRYPDSLFDDIVELGSLTSGSTAVEIGAGTGIATLALCQHGLAVTAVEPAPHMAAIGEEVTGPAARWIVGRVEDVALDAPVDLVASFNAWHWVDPAVGVERAAHLLAAGGSIALVWTPVVSWGSEAFERAIAVAFGAPWPKVLEPVLDSRLTIERDTRFGAFEQRRHRFERELDAATFVAVTRTYGGPHTAERDAILTRLVEDAGGSVTKVEDAVLYLARRR